MARRGDRSGRRYSMMRERNGLPTGAMRSCAPCNEAIGVRTGIGAKTTFLATIQTDYVKAELATSHDILAALDYFLGQGFVDPNLVVFIGQSEDGPGSAAADSRKPPGVVGFVNFSGGRGSRGSGSNCSHEHLVDATGHLGRTTTILNIWIHGSEDYFFGFKIS